MTRIRVIRGFGPTDAEPTYDTSLGDRHHRTRCSARKPGRSERLTAGSVAGQLAKFDGARVVGSASGAEKCALLTDRLGFDAAVDHRGDDWASSSPRRRPTASTTSRTSAANTYPKSNTPREGVATILER